MTDVSASEMQELSLEELEQRVRRLSRMWIDRLLGELEAMGTSGRAKAAEESRDVNLILESLDRSLDLITRVRATME